MHIKDLQKFLFRLKFFSGPFSRHYVVDFDEWCEKHSEKDFRREPVSGQMFRDWEEYIKSHPHDPYGFDYIRRKNE